MVTLSIGADPRSTRTVRSALREDLLGRGVSEESVDDVLVVACELVTNAVCHALPLPSGRLSVQWTIDDGCVTVRTTDGGAAHGDGPVPGCPGPQQTNGRGLAIVDALCEQWGIDSGPSSVTVWATCRL